MRWSFSIGRIAGIPVRLHVTFLVFVAWMAVSEGLTSGDTRRALSTLTCPQIFTPLKTNPTSIELEGGCVAWCAIAQ